ncbi:MAG: AMP-binding protein [Epsilonproteobacteria bacterium]|nr:AMP-binding protein [Campylobacterota bacterium]
MGSYSNSQSTVRNTCAQEQAIFNKIKKTYSDNNSVIHVSQLLRCAYEKYPTNTALISTEKTINYTELYFRAGLLCDKLSALGIQARDHVILYYENALEFYVAYFAVWQLNAVIVPLNTFLHQHELDYIITDAAPKAIIASPSLLKTVESVQELRQQRNEKKFPLVLSSEIFDWQTPVPEKINFTPACDGKGYELATLLYTSGTTGAAKGVMISSDNAMINAMQGYARFVLMGMTDKERFFCVLPLFHVFAQNTCMWLPIMTGSAVIVVSKVDRKLIMDNLEQHKPTLFFGVPSLYGLLCLMRNANFDSVKVFVSGADMLPDKIRAAFALVYGRKIRAGYGLSEASPVVAVHHVNQEQPTYVVGQPLVGIECQIRDKDGNVLPPGTVGSFWLRGENIMMGYYKAPEQTAKVLQDGWLDTGDLASLDQEGNIAIRGRDKDLIIHKGFNIYPAEIENVLLKHPAVFKAAVIGKSDQANGQVPVAFVAIKPDAAFTEQNLRALCANHLASYKIPRSFIVQQDLPLNATGKIDKKKLTQTFST